MSNDIAEMNVDIEIGADPPTNRYARSAAVRAALRDLEGRSNAEILAAFDETDVDAEGYRPAEVLVTFLLRAIEQDDERQVNKLFALLRARSRPYIRGWLGGIQNEEDRKDIENDVIFALTKHLVAGGPKADYPQARYWNYIHMRTLSAITCFQRQQRKDLLLADRAPADPDEPPDPTDEIRDTQLSPEEWLMIEDALQALPEPLRETYILRHHAGWPAGDDRKEHADPDQPTLKDYFGITRRAVDKRLERAEKLLAEYRKDPA